MPKVKPQETADILSRIDHALYEGNEGRIRRALEDSIFPLVEDGNGPGQGLQEIEDEWGDVFQPWFNSVHDMDKNHVFTGQCKNGRCMDGHSKGGPSGHMMDSLWRLNTFFTAARNDANAQIWAEMGYAIKNEDDPYEREY